MRRHIARATKPRLAAQSFAEINLRQFSRIITMYDDADTTDDTTTDDTSDTTTPTKNADTTKQ